MAQQHSDIPYEIFTADNLYTCDELDEWIKYVSHRSSDRPFTTNVQFKNGKVECPEWTTMMFNRLQTMLPDKYTDRQGKEWSFVRACKYIMYAQVGQDQSFMIHTDTGCEYDEATNEYSKFTVLTYLNDEFDGGNTVFYDNNYTETCRIVPKRGTTLVFDIDVFHAGEPVLQGEKLWIGTEIVCRLEV